MAPSFPHDGKLRKLLRQLFGVFRLPQMEDPMATGVALTLQTDVDCGTV